MDASQGGLESITLDQVPGRIGMIRRRQYAYMIPAVPLCIGCVAMTLANEPLLACASGITGIYLLVCATSLTDDIHELERYRDRNGYGLFLERSLDRESF